MEEKADKSLFNPPMALPTRLQKKKMMALALEVGVKATMLGHMYQMDGKVYLQADGEPIGLELSGALARVIMLLWDRELLRRLLHVHAVRGRRQLRRRGGSTGHALHQRKVCDQA